MKAPCAKPASGSALPCPKRCSRSAGVSAWRDRQKIDERADHVERGIGQRGHHRHGIGDNEGDDFDRDEEQARDADRGQRDAAHQRAMLGDRAFELGHGRRHGNKRSVRQGMSGAVAAIDQPVVQAERPVAPEFDLEAG